MAWRDAAQRHDHLLRDLNEERAAALMRTSRTLESLIARLDALRARIADAGEDRAGDAIAAYADLRRQALRYRWYLEVQREALGMRRHELLDEFYRIPPPITNGP